MRTTTFTVFDYLPDSLREIPKRRAAELTGAAILAGVAASSLALLSWSVEDPSLNHATSAPIHNWLARAAARRSRPRRSFPAVQDRASTVAGPAAFP